MPGAAVSSTLFFAASSPPLDTGCFVVAFWSLTTFWSDASLILCLVSGGKANIEIIKGYICGNGDYIVKSSLYVTL